MRSPLLFVGLAASVAACTLFTDLGGFSGSTGLQDAADAPLDTGMDPSLVDDSEPTFRRGSYLDTQWIGAHVTLAPTKTRGDYLSRVIDLGSPRALARLEWVPRAPYAKALPDGDKVESGYARGSLDMHDALTILHLDGDVLDRSIAPIGIQIGAPSGEGVTFAPALFDRGLADTMSTWAYAIMDAKSPLATGTSDFTWSLWVKSSQPCTQNIVYLGGEDVTDARPHTWIGCAATFNQCPTQDGTGRVAGYISTTQQDGVIWCGQRPVNDGKWHQLTLVKRGHSPASVKIFLDGTLEAALSPSFAASFVYDAGSELALGAFSKGNSEYQSSGMFDDVAVLRRALTDEEVSALASRGHLRLSFQIRPCVMPDCADNPPFVGPKGDGSQSFLDRGLAPPAEADLSTLLPTRYFQYRAHFETETPAQAPELVSVRLVPK